MRVRPDWRRQRFVSLTGRCGFAIRRVLVEVLEEPSSSTPAWCLAWARLRPKAVREVAVSEALAAVEQSVVQCLLRVSGRALAGNFSLMEVLQIPAALAATLVSQVTMESCSNWASVLQVMLASSVPPVRLVRTTHSSGLIT